MAPNNKTSGEDTRYHLLNVAELKALCRARALDPAGNRVQCVKHLVERDRRRWANKLTKFNEHNDPTGAKQVSQIEEDAEFEGMCETSLILAHVDHYEHLIGQKRSDNEKALANIAATKKKRLAEHSMKVKTRLEKEKKAEELAAKASDHGANSIPQELKPATRTGDNLTHAFDDGSASSPVAEGKSGKQKETAAVANDTISNTESVSPDAVAQEKIQDNPHPGNILKRSFADADVPETSSAVSKKIKPLIGPTAAPINEIEPPGLCKRLIDQEQTFLMLSGPLIINNAKLQGIRDDLTQFETLAIRADKFGYYVLFDSSIKDYPVYERFSQRQMCQSRVQANLQTRQHASVDTTIGLPPINELQSWKKGKKDLYEGSWRHQYYNGHN